MTRCHCARAHAGEDGVVVDASVVDDDLHRAGLQQRLQRGAAGLGVGDVEGDGLGAAAIGADLRGDRLGGVAPGVGVDDDVQAVAGEATGDGAAEIAAAAGDEGSFHGSKGFRSQSSGVSSTTASRPVTTGAPACVTRKP